MDPRTAKAYLLTAAFTVAVVLSVAAAVNAVVNPYGLFRLVRIEGFNAEKPAASRHARMVKAHAVRRLHPRGVILGSSRAETAFDPGHPAWEPDARPVYNLALPSGSILEVLAYLEHAHRYGGVRHALVVLDLFMFNARRQLEPDFERARLVSAGRKPPYGQVADVLKSLLSIDALQASLETLREQGAASHVPYLDDGSRHPTRAWERIRSRGGHHRAFVSNERYSLVAEDGWALFSLTGAEGRHTTLETYRRLLDFCRDNGIDMRAVIGPVHARKLEVVWQLGLWETLESWKRQLVAAHAEEARRAGKEMFPLWDFSGYGTVTTEAVPPAGDDRSEMRWYWEGSHYKRSVGGLVQSRVLGAGRPGNGVAHDFGIRLTVQNVDRALAEIREARQRYVEGHERDVAEIRRLIVDTESDRKVLKARNGHGTG